MTLPQRLFFTGVPGSRWSGIAQNLEQHSAFDTSDRTAERSYSHHSYSGHVGVYFGFGMEFEPVLNSKHLDQPYHNHPLEQCTKTRIHKSHEWSYMLDQIKQKFPNDWIMLVYRPDQQSFDWWMEAGGFNISYPSYAWYKNTNRMRYEIARQNQYMLKFAHKHCATWEYFTSEWIYKQFGLHTSVTVPNEDILVTVIR